MEPLRGYWRNVENIGRRTYICGYCGVTTGVIEGYNQSEGHGRIYICGGCNRPTYLNEVDRIVQSPAPVFGNPVLHLPPEISELYDQACRSTQVNAYSGCILLCRKLLMHVAVEQGADPSQSFLSYVEYLVNNGYVPPNGRGWVDQIRQRGNEANHEIYIASCGDAIELLAFVEMLLKFVYEFPARIIT